MNVAFGMIIVNLAMACCALIILMLPARILPQKIRGWMLVVGLGLAIASVLLLFVSVQMRLLAFGLVDYLIMFGMPLFSLTVGIVLSRRYRGY